MIYFVFIFKNLILLYKYNFDSQDIQKIYIYNFFYLIKE